MRKAAIAVFVAVAASAGAAPAGKTDDGDDYDYCAMLGTDDIQGKKSGFLAGNKAYYVGGKYLVQHCAENETIGLSHPFFHDLRSRGTGIATYKGVGTGNDFDGWEFHRATDVARASVVTPELTWVHPPPTHMYWRPDKMIVEYELSNPFLEGVYDGWCSNWTQIPYPPGSNSSSFWVGLTESECWAHCTADANCSQAVYEAPNSFGQGQCWTGTNTMTEAPTGSRPGCSPGPCADKCFAKGTTAANVTIREEKFIADNDVVSTIITASRPVMLQIDGRSFAATGGAGKVLSLHGQCSCDANANAVRVVEGGTVSAQVQNVNGQPVYATGKLMYDGMTSVLTASRQLQNCSTRALDPKSDPNAGTVAGVCGYTFTVPVDSKGTTISWAMADDAADAVRAVQTVVADAPAQLAAKTAHMNGLLNDVVPYFRCSDDDIVKLYYYLWSLYLMYFTQGDAGTMQAIPHTQTAVNNFLGMHRFDAVFQILVGSWASPARHDYYANGNVLAWSQLLPFRQGEQLPDNFGTTWASGCYGGETIGHVIGACQIYEHSGNKTFLAAAYDFYKTLFWPSIGDTLFHYAYDSALCLNKMADALGFHNDSAHWNASVDMDHAQQAFANGWEQSTPNMWGDTSGGMGWTNVAVSGVSSFPREYVQAMAEHWLDDSVKGFRAKVPLARTALQDWPAHDPGDFAVVPDGNWYMLHGLYRHQVDAIANKLTLEHLRGYNMEWGGIPVAPEARNDKFELFGDQYSNFNAGKILLLLEGIGGLRYSVPDDSFTFADNLPTNWTFMEFRVPVVEQAGAPVKWVKARAERQCNGGGRVTKTVTVDGNPFSKLQVQPWAEDARVAGTSPAGGSTTNQTVGHVSWNLGGASARVVLTLDGASC